MGLNQFYVRKRKKRSAEINPEDIFVESANPSQFNEDQFEGRFERPIESAIFLLFALFCIFMGAVFVSKAYTLQIRDFITWSDRAVSNYIRKTPVFAYRGVIKDRNGQLLAWNETPLGVDTTSGDVIPKRVYTSDPGFSNMLGFVTYPRKDSSGFFWQDVYIGTTGLEKKYDSYLAGTSGERIIEVSANGSIARDNIINDPQSGAALETYIDARLQTILYNKLKEVVDAQEFHGGAAAIMNVNNGEVLAMVSYPDYDNNIFVNASTSEEKELKASYLEDSRTPMTNRVVSGAFTPGSTVKPFVGYAALVEGVATKDTVIYSSGQLVIKNRYGGPDTIFRDWKAHGYVDIVKAIAQSSDEYFYQVGGGFEDQLGLGIKRIEEYADLFGLASSTGIDMPGEVTGIVPSPEWKKKMFADGDWLLGNTYHTSIGQYGFQTSPIALLRGLAALANGGKLVTPKIAHTPDEDTTIIDLNLDQVDLDTIHRGMLAATGPEGTAHHYGNLSFKVGAKTGTAQLGVYNERVHSWSMGYWPYENPEYAFVFLMESGPASNTVGASVPMRKAFTEILEVAPEYGEF